MGVRSGPAWLLPVFVLLLVSDVSAAEGQAWRVSGDLRFGWYADQRRTRAAEKQRNDEGRMRLRAALDGELGGGWSARGRLAATAGTDTAPERFYLRFDAPTRSGAALGDATLDQLYLRHDRGDWRVTLGRFSSGFDLLGVAGKSLDRKPASNVSITWTDGIHIERRLDQGWRAHAILQYQDSDGLGQATQAPLDYSRGGSRVGSWFALVAEPVGVFEQRSLSVTWMPDTLAVRGVEDPSRKDYLAFDGKLALAWPLGESGMRLVVGGEVGYAPNRPLHGALSTGGTGRADGWAWQISANLYDMAPGHNLGVNHGRADAGWLLSPDHRANDKLSEVRYQWRFHPAWSMEARYRIRQERQVPASALRERQDRDFYVRVTRRF